MPFETPRGVKIIISAHLFRLYGVEDGFTQKKNGGESSEEYAFLTLVKV